MINVCYVSKHYRVLVLSKFAIYFNLANEFCDSKQWNDIISQNLTGLLKKIYEDLTENINFDFEYLSYKFIGVKRHLSLFSVCLHFLTCGRSCDRLPKSWYCFYCSRIRARNFESPSYCC